MPTMTYAEFIKRERDELVQGVAEDIYTLNPIYSVMPWDGYEGSGISVNRETTIGDSQILDIGGTITAKAASVVIQTLLKSTTFIGDAEINNLHVAHAGGGGEGNTTVATEISSKAKSVGRLIQNAIAGSYTGANAALVNSLPSMTDASQLIGTGAGGVIVTFALLDDLLAKVDAKDGQVDFIIMSQRDFNKYKTLLRTQGGTSADWIVNLPDGRTTIGYENIPIFVNRWLSTTETDNGAAQTGGALTSIYAGCWDDGSRKIGCSMIHPEAVPGGIIVEPVGAKETTDDMLWRVKAYCNFAVFNRRAIARLAGLKVV